MAVRRRDENLSREQHNDAVRHAKRHKGGASDGEASDQAALVREPADQNRERDDVAKAKTNTGQDAVAKAKKSSGWARGQTEKCQIRKNA